MNKPILFTVDLAIYNTSIVCAIGNNHEVMAKLSKMFRIENADILITSGYDGSFSMLE